MPAKRARERKPCRPGSVRRLDRNRGQLISETLARKRFINRFQVCSRVCKLRRDHEIAFQPNADRESHKLSRAIQCKAETHTGSFGTVCRIESRFENASYHWLSFGRPSRQLSAEKRKSR